MTDQEYKQLKAENDAVQKAASEARGALKNLQARLKTEFGLASTAAAKAKLKSLAAEKLRLETEVEEEAEAYKQEFAHE